MNRCLSSRLVATLVLATSFVASTVVATPANGSPAAASSVLDPATDIAVAINVPASVARGGRLDASMTVSNFGTTTARDVRCGVATPRVDGATDFKVGIATKRVLDTVEGNESREFRFATVAPGASRTVPMSAIAARGTSLNSFALSAYCVPLRVDQRHSNNAATVVVALR